MTMSMDETFAAALRELLVEQVDDAETRSRWSARSRRWVAGAAAAVVLAAAGGVSYATGFWSAAPPGGNEIRDLAVPVTTTGVGTQTIQLGTPPAGTTSIQLSLTCLTPGTFGFSNGASLTCDRADVARRHLPLTTYTLAIKPGEQSTEITAAPGARWRLTATYAAVTTTAWGVNASGQTYGVQNQDGTPDLIAVEATNHRDGYVYAKQLNANDCSDVKNPKAAVACTKAHAGKVKTIPVYTQNGKTKIGTFTAGEG